jgi:N-acetylglucosaminyldiphosphoundecaprenol N-acetyl-beta-D-mannosaminyltransferase
MTRAHLGTDTTGNTPESPSPITDGWERKRKRSASDRTEDFQSRRILGMRVDATTYEEVGDAVLELARAGQGGAVCCSTIHMAMECFDDPNLRRKVNAADRVTPDGVSLVWALGALGVRGATRVYGPLLTLELCRRAAEAGMPVGFYGGTPEVVTAVRDRVQALYPGLEVPFAWSPPFRALDPHEDARITDAVEVSEVGILFVGLGCPKQEHWMAAHRDRLSCVIVAVGAAFDFIAGTQPQAPSWMQRAGLEWAFRLASEPRRLWRRYLVGNLRFLFHFLLRGNPG